MGPFTEIGYLRKPDGSELRVYDPMIFEDDDGRVYLYWGLGDPGIFGAELDRNNLCQLLTEPQILFAFNPDHEWERFGDHNQAVGHSNIEGAWMHCWRGPNDTLWAFYTTVVCYEHIFERRIGMDPAGIDDDGNLYVLGSSDSPQYIPGASETPELGNSAGLLPLTFSNPTTASSCAEGHSAVYAVDESMLSWWQPCVEDPLKQLTVALRNLYEGPAFNDMLKAAETRCFDIVLCKTQSRFTRDMELVEKYIHTKLLIF